MKYFSMFSGIGGFELGIQKAVPNAECVGFSEIDKYAVSIYRRHFKGHKNYGDATKIIPGGIPDFDVLVGGFPCQAFSIAGKRKGFGDTRGTLFFEIARIVREKQPRILVLENVKGLLSHDKGSTYARIISTLDELGYDTQRQTCNSKNHGVPQNRERVFIVGHLRTSGHRPIQIFPFGNCDEQTTEIRGDKAHTITSRYGHEKVKMFNAERGFGGKRNPIGRSDGFSYTITKAHANHPVQIVGGSQNYRVYDTAGIAVSQKALGGGMGAKTGLYAIPVLTPDRLNKRQNGRRFKDVGDPSFTLTSQDRHGVMVDNRIRKLMPIECEQLQGFPRDWTKFGKDCELISDSQRYKCCGNAVTVNVVASIFSKLNNG